MMRHNERKKVLLADKFIEYGLYCYLFLIFFAKGEGIRNVIIFGSFIVWLLTITRRPNLHLLKDKISIFVWLFVFSMLISTVTSIDVPLSLRVFKGYPLKFLLLFAMFSTVISSRERLERISAVSFYSMIIIVGSAYFSYLYHNVEMLKPDTVLVHLWHNKFARVVNALVSFSLVLYFVWQKRWSRLFLSLIIVISIISILMSTSRGGYLAMIFTGWIWIMYISKKNNFEIKKLVISVVAVLLVTMSLLYLYVPSVKNRISPTVSQISTMNERSELWSRAFHVIKKRPILGWGLGDSIFKRKEIYSGSNYKTVPEKGIHNMFIKVLVHQGITGFLIYSFLIFLSVIIFWKNALRKQNVESLILAACAAVLVGNYVVHNLLESVFRLEYLAVILGVGVAANGLSEREDRWR